MCIYVSVDNNDTDSTTMTLIAIITSFRRSYVMSVGVRLNTESIVKDCDKFADFFVNLLSTYISFYCTYIFLFYLA